MASSQSNLQDTFLNSVRKSKNPVTLFLVNGVKLQGVVTWFDNFSVLLRREEYPSSEISERRKTLNEWEFCILMVPFIKCY